MKPDELRGAACAHPGCENPKCDLVLNSRCHRGAGVEVTYLKRDHALRIDCKRCGKLVVVIEFEGAEPPPRPTIFNN